MCVIAWYNGLVAQIALNIFHWRPLVIPISLESCLHKCVDKIRCNFYANKSLNSKLQWHSIKTMTLFREIVLKLLFSKFEQFLFNCQCGCKASRSVYYVLHLISGSIYTYLSMRLNQSMTFQLLMWIFFLRLYLFVPRWLTKHQQRSHLNWTFQQKMKGQSEIANMPKFNNNILENSQTLAKWLETKNNSKEFCRNDTLFL